MHGSSKGCRHECNGAVVAEALEAYSLRLSTTAASRPRAHTGTWPHPGALSDRLCAGKSSRPANAHVTLTQATATCKHTLMRSLLAACINVCNALHAFHVPDSSARIHGVHGTCISAYLVRSLCSVHTYISAYVIGYTPASICVSARMLKHLYSYSLMHTQGYA